MNFRVSCLAGLLALSMGGCASAPLVSAEGSRYDRIDNLYNYGAGGRDLRLVVRGNPFPMAEADFERLVEAAAQGPIPRRDGTDLTLFPRPAARGNFMLVLAFDPPASTTGSDLCAGRDQALPPAAGAGVIHVEGAFCVSGRAYTAASGQVAAARPTDPGMQALVRQMIFTLFRPDLPIGGDARNPA